VGPAGRVPCPRDGVAFICKRLDSIFTTDNDGCDDGIIQRVVWFQVNDRCEYPGYRPPPCTPPPKLFRLKSLRPRQWNWWSGKRSGQESHDPSTIFITDSNATGFSNSGTIIRDSKLSESLAKVSLLVGCGPDCSRSAPMKARVLHREFAAFSHCE